ncbi:hypothetical protein GGTG_04683 [Gaeumannomyces tritici R3-111a-1]|uniref:Protein kinase domain-containing protein n=1 Tax=Gaeumannomyces tritici (strain R3-111a-1) TaxID=644352 RepID=J3NTT4_GAET3|nr:hypothetical protein GGTG_04683 [Gaeumannomyces tritici R3-111a-1]EJT79599.1 hypothetical protein GGTG_04683 [Gaeumannomyces tritici R3-111a-1]
MNHVIARAPRQGKVAGWATPLGLATVTHGPTWSLRNEAAGTSRIVVLVSRQVIKVSSQSKLEMVGSAGDKFAIEINFNSGALLIKNYSRNGTRITSYKLGTLTLERAQRAIPPNEHVQIVIGKLMITIQPPVHTLNLESEATTSAKTLGHDLGRELGFGTSATVYRAVHGATRKAVAVKQFRTTDVKRHSDGEFLDIRHPNIVDYQCFVIWPDRPPTLVMELVDGPGSRQGT